MIYEFTPSDKGTTTRGCSDGRRINLDETRMRARRKNPVTYLFWCYLTLRIPNGRASVFVCPCYNLGLSSPEFKTMGHALIQMPLDLHPRFPQP